MHPALIWDRHYRERSGVAPVLEELQLSRKAMRRRGSSCCDGQKHAGLCDSDRGPSPPTEGDKEGFWRWLCLNGELRDE